MRENDRSQNKAHRTKRCTGSRGAEGFDKESRSPRPAERGIRRLQVRSVEG